MTALVYDIFRLFIGPWSATPRGIDRIDLAYAQHLFNHWPDTISGVMPTPWGVRLYDRALVLRGLERLRTQAVRIVLSLRPKGASQAYRDAKADAPHAPGTPAEPDPQRHDAAFIWASIQSA